MALNPNELFSSSTVSPLLRVEAKTIQPKTFASGSGTLGQLTPVVFNTSTNFWQVWSDAVAEISTITANATPNTGGTFTLTVNGQETAAIAFDATAAVIQTALEALSNVESGDVTAVATTGTDLGDANAVVTLTWGGNFTGTNPTIAIDDSSLTGGSGDHALAEATAGIAAADVNTIKGFVWPDAVVLDSDEEVIGNVLLEGKLHYDDIALPAGEIAANLKGALRDGPRALGLIIQGLDQVR